MFWYREMQQSRIPLPRKSQLTHYAQGAHDGKIMQSRCLQWKKKIKYWGRPPSLPLLTRHEESVGFLLSFNSFIHTISKQRVPIISAKSYSPPDTSRGCLLHQDKVFCRRELDTIGKPQPHHSDFQFFCYCVIFKQANKKAFWMFLSEDKYIFILASFSRHSSFSHMRST